MAIRRYRRGIKASPVFPPTNVASVSLQLLSEKLRQCQAIFHFWSVARPAVVKAPDFPQPSSTVIFLNNLLKFIL